MPVKDKEGEDDFWKRGHKEAIGWKLCGYLCWKPPTHSTESIPERNYLPINCEPQTKAGVESAVKFLNEGKAAGPDNIPPGALKSDIKATEDILREFFT